MYSINFRLRYDKSITSNQRTVNVRLKINGSYVQFATSVKVAVGSWCQEQQSIKGFSVENSAKRSLLKQIEADLINLILLNPNLSAREIADIYTKPDIGAKPVYFVLKVYDEYIKEMKESLDGTNLELAPNTKQRWYNCKLHLSEFMNGKDLDLDKLDYDFGRRLYLYLVKKPKKRNTQELIGHDYAVRNLTYLNEVMEYAQRKRYLQYNVLDIEGFKRNPPKKIQALEREHITQLSLMKCKGVLEDARVIFLAMVYSGINHCDLPKLADLKGDDCITFQVQRKKNNGKDVEKAIIPVIPELRKLLEKCNYQLPRHDINVINRHLHIFESLLDVSINITTYTARKTAAKILSEKGVTIDVISKILGHTSVLTTQRYYLNVSQKRVENETKHLQFNHN
jgi:integrase/recombinase XerD